MHENKEIERFRDSKKTGVLQAQMLGGADLIHAGRLGSGKLGVVIMEIYYENRQLPQPVTGLGLPV
ncbi:hypothetical protein, partial [Rhizobium leguminosarum]|uniref:hypothetical protein n=1 Tax=Rhizobium leguminosarum TaxID=384 RepID=UPI003F9E4E0C